MGKYAPAQKASTELAQVGADPQPLPAQARSSEHAVLVQQAFAAIEAAVSVEDLTRIRDQWDGIAAYAAKAKDFEIRATAEEIKARAERKLGQMMQEQKETVGLNKGGRPKTGFSKTRLPTLAGAGVDKNLAHRARRQAAKSEEEFEADVAEKKGSITEHKRKRKTVKKAAARRAAKTKPIEAPVDAKIESPVTVTESAVEDEASTSAEGRKAEYAGLDLTFPNAAAAAPPATNGASAASTKSHKAVAAEDTALHEFDGHVLRLLQMTSKAKPGRFAKTGVNVPGLMRLSNFFAEVAEAVGADAS
jgi:hypothetical protein